MPPRLIERTGDSLRPRSQDADHAVDGLGSGLARRQLALLVGIALAARVAYLVSFLRHYAPRRDAHHYFTIASSFSNGDGLSAAFPFLFQHPTAFRPPLYPVVLGSLYSVTGPSVLAGQLLNIVIGTAVVVLAATLGTRLGGPRAGMAAGLIAALYPPLLANDAVLLSEPLSLALLLGTLLLLLDGRVIGAGLATGLLVLTRPSAQAFVLVIAVWLVWRLGWRAAIRYVCVAVVVVAPWIVRNWLLVGEPVLVTSNGFNLTAKYSAEAQRSPYFADAFGDPRFDRLLFLHQNEAEADQVLQDHAVDSVREKPSRIASVILRNAQNFFEAPPGTNESAERDDGRNITFRTVMLPAFYVVTIAGFTGLFLNRRNRVGQLLLVTAGYFTVIGIAVLVPPRIRAPVDVVLCIGAGALVARWLDRRHTGAAAVVDSSIAISPRDVEPRAQGSDRKFFIVIGAVVLALVLGTLVARPLVEDRAQREMRQALTRDVEAVERLARGYPLDPTEEQPTFEGGRTGEHALRLEEALWRYYPELPSELGDRAHDAARALRRFNFDARALGLMIAAEQIEADEETDPWSISDVRQRYEAELRPNDERYPPWPDFVSADRARRAVRLVRELEQALS